MPRGHLKNGNICKATPMNLAQGEQHYQYRTTQIALNPTIFNAIRERAIEHNTSFSEQIRVLIQKGLQNDS